MAQRIDTSVPAMRQRLEQAKASGAYFAEFKGEDYPGPLDDLAECLEMAGAMKVQVSALFQSVIVQLRKEPDGRPRHVKE